MVRSLGAASLLSLVLVCVMASTNALSSTTASQIASTQQRSRSRSGGHGENLVRAWSADSLVHSQGMQSVSPLRLRGGAWGTAQKKKKKDEDKMDLKEWIGVGLRFFIPSLLKKATGFVLLWTLIRMDQ